jgi:type IV pilus assembly protein PilA
MLSKLYSPSKRDGGFTLLELLVVVIVIGLLAAIALPIFINQQRAAVDAAVKSDVRNTVDEVQGWRTLHNLEVPASAASYLDSDGKITTSKGTYMNVSFVNATSYTVCGYNHGGLNYTAYDKAWSFNSNTGKFSDFTVGECVNALTVDPNAVADPEDSTTPPKTAKDPDGKYTDPTTGDNSGGGGGGPVVTPPPAGNGDPSATCPAPDNSAVTLTRPTTKLSNVTSMYLGKTRLEGDHDRVANAQQASDMKKVSDWVADYAAAHSDETVDNSYVDRMANEAYYGSTKINVYFFNKDEQAGSNAVAQTQVVDYDDGYSWYMGIGSDPQSFAAEWDNDQNPDRVNVSNHSVESRPAILNTSGHQTEGYLHIVTGGDRSWTEYVPECGSEQKFGGFSDTVSVDPGNDPTGDPGTDPSGGGSDPSATEMYVSYGQWQYSYDGPTAADELSKKGDYPGMCYFDRDDVEQALKFYNGNEICVLNTGDGSANPDFGTQFIRTADLTGDNFPSDNKLKVTGDYDFMNKTYTCTAGDPVHKLSEGTILRNDFQAVGPHSEYLGGSYYGEVDASDYWTMTTYEQCDTDAKVARIAIILTYPTDITRMPGAGDRPGSAYFNVGSKQYYLEMSGEASNPGSAHTRFNRDDPFDRDHRSTIQYVPNTYHGQIIYANCNLHLDLVACQ